MANLYFIKKFTKKNISFISQLGLSKNNLDSLEAVRQETNISCNFLEWSGLRSAIPSHIKKDDGVCTLTKLGFFVVMLFMMSVWPKVNSIIIC